MSDSTSPPDRSPPTSSSPVTAFVELNAKIHAELEERHLLFLEALTKVDLRAAKEAFERLITLLHAHVEVEDRHILPTLRRLGAVDADSGAAVDVEKRIQLVDGDHTILQRSEVAIADALAEMSEQTTRREVVVRFDTFMRFGRVLEHHSSREEKQLYPLFDAHPALEADERESLLATLGAVLD